MSAIPSFLLAQAPPAAGENPVLIFFRDGGLFMYPLVIASLVGVTVIVFKLLSLRRERIVPEGLARKIEAFDASGGREGWEPLANDFRLGHSTLARLGAVAVKHAGKPQSEIAHAVEAAARGELVRIHSGIQTLDVLITIGPLLGLLGTVSGLVAVFRGLSDTSDHLAIARGIAEALHTTIFGISIAVGAVVAHGWFTRRIELMTSRMESLLADLSHLFGQSRPNV
jgi:biopolymer transport protein ExbB